MKNFNSLFNQLTAMPKRLAMVLTVLFTLGVGSMLGAETYSWTCSGSTTFSTSGSSLNGVTWKASTTGTSQGTGVSGEKCVQIAKNTGLTLETTFFKDKNITSISIQTWGSQGNTFYLKDDNTQLATISIPTSYTSNGAKITFSNVGMVKTKLVFNWASASKAFNVRSINITYEDAAPSCSVKPTVGNALQSITVTENSIKATIPISAVGGCNITENGLVYSTTNSTPTVGGSGCVKVTTTACGSTAANKTVTITGLNCGTSYYIRGYATNEAGTSYTNVTTKSTSDCPKYTVTFHTSAIDEHEEVEESAGAGVTPPTMKEECGEWEFQGWSESSSNSETSTTPLSLVTLTSGKYYPTEDVDLYPVYTKTEDGGGSVEETLAQTLQYDTWSYSGSTTNKTSYRLFHSNSYVESAEFDLSTLSKVVVYGGTFGGDSYNKLTIAGVVGGTTTTWKSVTVSGNSQTGVNTYTGGTSLSGTGKLRVTSNSGSSSSSGSGVRISKIMIYTLQATSTTYYYSYPQCTTEATVTLDLNGGSFDPKPDGWEEDGNNYTKTVNSGDQVTLPEPNKTGHDFEGWYNASTKVTSPYTLTGNTTLTAHWTPQTYDITYKDQGNADFTGDNEVDLPATHTYGQQTDLVDATKSGYNFLGWFTTPNCSGSAITQLGATDYTGNITLYAKWEVAVITYTITCSVNEETTSKTYEQGATIEFPAVTPCDGMVHVGWTETERYANETTAPSDLLTAATAIKTTTYYAVFAKLVEDSNAPYQLVEADRADWSGKYLIAYSNSVFADGRLGGKTDEGSIGKTGHYVDLSSHIDGNNIPALNGDHIYVKLVPCEGGGYLLQTQDGKYNYYSKNTDNGLNANTDRKVAEPYKLNIVFKQSNDIQLALSGSAKGSVFHHNPTNKIFQFYKDASMSPVYLYRQNEVYTDYSTRCKYTVTFDANGHGEAPESQVVYKNELATEPDEDPQGEGYNFQGWYDNQQCTGNAYNFATPISDNITLYAKWTPCVYTITYKDQGNATFSGSHESGNPTQHTYGTATTLKGATKTGYTFGGWYKEAACTNKVTSLGATEYTANITLYAKWTVNSYTITFKNWDETVLQTSSVNYGETPSYTGETPTREQTAQYTYTFKGWSPTIASVTQDQVYTAQFTQTTRQYTVTWYDGTGNAHKTQTANYNATVALPTTNPNPCDDEYPHFIGWTADPIVGSTTTQPTLVENVKVTGDCDYYAVFAKGEGGSSDYKLVTSAPADWSGTYLIVNTDDKKAWKGSATSDNGAIDVTITNNTILSNATTDNETFTIATMTGGYSIKGTSGKYIYGKQNDNTTNYADAAQLNTISIDNNNNVTITSNTSVLRQNNSNASLFRYYKSSTYSSQHPIQLYKKGSGVNYTSFITTCCTSWSAPTLTYTTPLEENGTAMPQITGTTHGTVTYESSNPSILSVNSTTGEITAKAPGTAKITATWSGDATYCSVSSTSNVITVKGSFSVIYYSNGGTGTMANQKADEDNVIAQLNANQFTRDGYAFVGWNTKANGTGTAYADQATDITLTGNLTLYAQWAAIVTLNDAGNETTTHPTTVNGTITLPNGENACDPYEFVGWTTVATGDWNEGINEPTLVATTYTPSAPTTLYAVYKIQSEGNSNAFKLSFESSYGTTYYVGEYGSSPYLRGFSNITKEEAVTFIRTKMYPNDDTKYYIYMEHEGEYLYCSSGDLYSTSSEPSESQGWVFHTVGDKIQIQAINQERYLSFADKDYDDDRINITTHQTGNQKSFNMLSAVTSTYVASPLCNQEIEIIFETGNGDFVDNAPATNPLTVSRGDVITLPTCEYPGYEFMGWLKDEQQLDPSDIIGTYYTGDYTVDGVSSTITFYAYYKVIPEEVEFTGKDDVELLMYYYDGTENYYYAVSHAAERGELSSKQNCFNATTWTFTNVGNMQYHIQDETGKYLGAYSDGDNDLILSATPKVWTFTEVNGLWKMVCENSPSRALMYISTGKTFANAAISNEGNGAYSYVTLGICPYPTYTTNPVLTQGFVVTNTAMVTSAAGQKVKAANALTLETRNIELPCTFTISAPNITFYDNTGAEVTELTASAASEQFELYFAYKPTAENTMEYPTITIVDDEMKTYTIKNRIYARSLPNTFAIVAKVGGMWYALPSQGLNSTDALVGYPVEVDDLADPTAVTAVPANADWSLRQVYVSTQNLDRFKTGGHNLVFVNNVSPEKALNPSSSSNYLLTNAQYNNYHNATNPGLYEWTPTTTDLETYQLTNVHRTTKQLNIATNAVFGVHASEVVTADVRFLPIQDRYTPLAAQVVEWKENSAVIMYNGDPAQNASVAVKGGAAQTTTLSSAQKDIAVYELAANGLSANPTEPLSITIGSEKVILPIPYIISGTTDDAIILGSGSVAAKKEVAKVADLVVLNGGKLTAAGASSNYYKFRNVTIYGGGKLVILSDKGFGVASLTLRAGGITDAGEYDYVYPQFELRGTFTNTAGKFYYDYITDYDHWYHLVLPFAADITTIKYPTEFYGANVTAGNKGSWVIKRYDGATRATGNYNAWVDIESEAATTTTAGQGYIFWGAPKKVSVNGGAAQRQKWGIQRITMQVTADNATTAENADKAIQDLGSYENVANNSGKDNDQGWNLIGNPYMVNLTGLNSQSLQIGQLIHELDASGNWTGKWHWDDTSEQTGLRYVTIPSDHFDTYTAHLVSAFSAANPMVAGRAFFVQIAEESVDLMFTAANRASLMPQLLAAQNTAVEVETGIILSSETMQDEVNFWIKDGKTNDYEYNADYPKTPNSTNFNIYGVHINGNLSWVAISPEIAEESMPIGYQVPAAGTYTLSISETYYSDLLDALYVTDHAMSPELTVDLMNAPYEFSVNQAETNNERFTVSVRLKSENQGPTTGLENAGVQRDEVTKFIYQDKMFILHNGIIYDATGKQVTNINK